MTHEPHQLRQAGGVIAGAIASLATYWLLMSLTVLLVTGAPGGTVADASRELAEQLGGTAMRLVTGTVIFCALVCAGYVAATLGGGPPLALGAMSSIVFIGLFLRSMQRLASPTTSGWAVPPVALAVAGAIVASAMLGGYVRARQLRRRAV